MEDRKIIELYNYRSENALIETDKKYGKIVTFLICKLIKNTLETKQQIYNIILTTQLL